MRCIRLPQFVGCRNGDLATWILRLARWQGQNVPGHADCRGLALFGSRSHPQWPSGKVAWQTGKVAILADRGRMTNFLTPTRTHPFSACLFLRASQSLTRL